MDQSPPVHAQNSAGSKRVSFNIENLTFWVRSEKIGCAVKISRGMMEQWNVGIPELAECDLFLHGWYGS
jgi:hypothetical protein